MAGPERFSDGEFRLAGTLVQERERREEIDREIFGTDALAAAVGSWQDSVPAPDHRTDELEGAFSRLWGKMRANVAGRLRGSARKRDGGGFSVSTAGLFDRETWAALFEEIAADAVADQVVAGATDAAVAGDVSEDALRAAVREHVEVARSLGSYLDSSVAEVVGQAMTERLSLNETVMRLREQSGLSEESARTTARTISVGAANAGLNSVWAADPNVVAKRWEAITTDDRTRVEHLLTDGQTVEVRSSFNVAGVPARFPGDPRLPPDLLLNCRCRLVPVLRDGSLGARSLASATFDVLRRIASALGIGRGEGDKAMLASRVRGARRGDNQPVERLNYRQLLEQAHGAGIEGRWHMTPGRLREELVASGVLS